MTKIPEGVDIEAVSKWMDAQGLAPGPIEDIQPLTGGTQNIMVRFARGGAEYVLRRPPLHKRRNSDATMGREARVLAALAGSDVPHPTLIAACEDIDVIGAAFYLMQPIDGFNPSEGLPPLHAESEQIRHDMGLSMATAIARLGEVDFRAVGLGDFGKPDGYLERQVERWQSQLDSYSELSGYPGPDIPGVKEVGVWLGRNLPSDYRPGILHGDYHSANVMFRRDGAELAAIVDWELATIGDPLLDLGALLAFPTSSEGEPQPLPAWAGFPTRTELLEQYRAHSTRNLEAVEWYEVLACYRLGIILEGSHARACAGKAPKEIGDLLHDRTLVLFEKALCRVG